VIEAERGRVHPTNHICPHEQIKNKRAPGDDEGRADRGQGLTGGGLAILSLANGLQRNAVSDRHQPIHHDERGRYMPDMTMRQAAQWAGVTRATVQKAIVRGRLSATKDELGHYHINPAELERVYQPKQVDGSRDTGKSHPETAELTAARERELALMRELVTKAEERAAELAQDRDHWREQAEAQTRLLTHQQQQPASQTPLQEPQTLPAIAPHGIRGRLGRWLFRGRQL